MSSLCLSGLSGFSGLTGLSGFSSFLRSSGNSRDQCQRDGDDGEVSGVGHSSSSVQFLSITSLRCLLQNTATSTHIDPTTFDDAQCAPAQHVSTAPIEDGDQQQQVLSILYSCL